MGRSMTGNETLSKSNRYLCIQAWAPQLGLLHEGHATPVLHYLIVLGRPGTTQQTDCLLGSVE